MYVIPRGKHRSECYIGVKYSVLLSSTFISCWMFSSPFSKTCARSMNAHALIALLTHHKTHFLQTPQKQNKTHQNCLGYQLWFAWNRSLISLLDVKIRQLNVLFFPCCLCYAWSIAASPWAATIDVWYYLDTVSLVGLRSILWELLGGEMKP